MRQNPWSGNYRNCSALELHYESQSNETEDQSPFQGEEGGDEVMTHRLSKFADLKRNEEIHVELSNETSPIVGDELYNRDEASRRAETSDHQRTKKEGKTEKRKPSH